MFTEDLFYFRLTCVHSALELCGRCTLQIYLLTQVYATSVVAELLVISRQCWNVFNVDFQPKMFQSFTQVALASIMLLEIKP